MILRNKRGEEYIEAAIVLPLVILTVLSMIITAVFLFRHLEKKTEAEISVMKEASRGESVFGVKSGGASSSFVIKGTFRKSVTRSDSVRAYVIDPADAVRLGELAE